MSPRGFCYSTLQGPATKVLHESCLGEEDLSAGLHRAADTGQRGHTPLCHHSCRAAYYGYNFKNGARKLTLK